MGTSRNQQCSFLEQSPQLQQAGLKGAVAYSDGEFNDARINLSLASTAAAHGAGHCQLRGSALPAQGRGQSGGRGGPRQALRPDLSHPGQSGHQRHRTTMEVLPKVTEWMGREHLRDAQRCLQELASAQQFYEHNGLLGLTHNP